MSAPGRAFSVPGNVLLMGEYAVLEEGGLGIALAVEGRAKVTLLSAPSLSIRGVWPGGGALWTRQVRDASPHFQAAAEVVEEWLLETRDAPLPADTGISIDTSAFFDTGGRKSGFGSSAAATVAAVIALLAAAGLTAEADDLQMLAISAHRRAQGGLGSGYDVTASLRGGVGVFHGGASPAWEPAALRWAHALFAFSGSRAVVTAGSVRRYADWKTRNTGAARDFLAASNAAVRSFLSAASEREASRSFAQAGRLGLDLGDAIGVPASLEVPAGLDPSWCKALGAGNEMGVCLLPEGALEPDVVGEARRIVVAQAGVLWEE